MDARSPHTLADALGAALGPHVPRGMTLHVADATLTLSHGRWRSRYTPDELDGDVAYRVEATVSWFQDGVAEATTEPWPPGHRTETESPLPEATATARGDVHIVTFPGTSFVLHVG